jgi:hypothetical protein
MKLKIIDFIKDNPEKWKEILSEKPYCLTIKEEDDFILLKYNQIDSDFTNEIVRECRGLILDKNFKPVCVPFFKFGNYGETYCPEIDWKSARVQEKVDGSLIKVWFYDEQWRVSTNGSIDAYTSDIGQSIFSVLDIPYKTFGGLFDKAKENCGLDFNRLDTHKTYMFELVSPYNKVVIPYKDIAIYHIGTRNNDTLEELDEDIGVQKPKHYDLHTLEDCIETASKMPYSEEGYVVVDKNWNRVKIKSPQYVAVHHLKNNGDLNISSLVQLVRANEIAEFCTYFPEYKEYIIKLKEKTEEVIKTLEKEIDLIKTKQFETQKDFALAVKDKPFSAFYFTWNKDRNLTPKQWFWEHDNNKIKEWLKNV